MDDTLESHPLSPPLGLDYSPRQSPLPQLFNSQISFKPKFPGIPPILQNNQKNPKIPSTQNGPI